MPTKTLKYASLLICRARGKGNKLSVNNKYVKINHKELVLTFLAYK